MKRLQDFTDVYPLFEGHGISANWLYALAKGNTKIYQGKTILNHYIDDNSGVCVINSGSINNARFPKSMLRDIKQIISNHEKIIISSEVDSVERYLSRIGFRYDRDNKLYIKDG